MSDLKAIQARSLEMAEYFVAFCKEHDLLCYLCGGGAIGALRNKGFIPWDDDLDFFMPRKDYEKLAELWPRYADERYFLLQNRNNCVCSMPLSLIHISEPTRRHHVSRMPSSA